MFRHFAALLRPDGRRQQPPPEETLPPTPSTHVLTVEEIYTLSIMARSRSDLDERLAARPELAPYLTALREDGDRQIDEQRRRFLSMTSLGSTRSTERHPGRLQPSMGYIPVRGAR